ncbi:MAG: WxcM-like domain-containing protein [Thaumarchaeota archaeon]|nr:WxcM-like domain-containing protein [Nitrososphaerota archaeon]MBI3641313.1 WxcM-like domain-containing protein [Nitrososphaerota archaeon]
MENDSVSFTKLEKHLTKDTNDQHVNGTLTVVWRDWDKILKHVPKMVYVSSVNPREIKGPHLHTKRNSYFVCIHGKVVFIVKDKNGNYEEIESSDDNPVLIHIPKNYASAHLNLSSEISRVLALADIAWKPNDDEMKNVTFDDYDWTKWKKQDSTSILK